MNRSFEDLFAKAIADDTSDEIFFREEDRLKRDAICESLEKGGLSAQIIAPHKIALIHYADLILNRLRALSRVRVEIYSPTSSVNVIDRFNQILSLIPIKEAVEQRKGHDPVRLMMVGYEEPVSASDIQLLTRLASNFPAANTHLVVLQVQDPSERLKTESDANSSRLLKWVIQLPDVEEGKAMLALHRQTNNEDAARALLKKTVRWDLALAENETPKTLPPPAKTIMQEEALAEASWDNDNDLEALDRETLNKPRPTSVAQRLLRATFTLLALIVVSAAIVLAVFPKHLTTLLSLFYPTSHSLTAPSTSQAKPSLSPPSPTTENLNRIEKSSSPSLTNPTITITASDDAPTALSPTPAKINPKEIVLPKAKSNPIDTKAPTEEAISPEPPITAPKNRNTANNEKLNWLKNTPNGQFLIQHVVMDSFAEANVWQSSHKGLNQSHIVSVQPKNQKTIKYAIVSGPFTSKSEAVNFIETTGVPKETWIRTVGSLKETLRP